MSVSILLSVLALSASVFALFSVNRLSARLTVESKRRDEEVAALIEHLPVEAVEAVADVSAKYAGGWQPE